MSHTPILDKIGQRFVNLSQANLRRKPVLDDAAIMRKSRNENRQKGDLNCKAFVDASTKMIAQCFE